MSSWILDSALPLPELRAVTLADVAPDDAAYAAAREAFEQHSVLS